MGQRVSIAESCPVVLLGDGFVLHSSRTVYVSQVALPPCPVSSPRDIWNTGGDADDI